jgi:hypothetical protein
MGGAAQYDMHGKAQEPSFMWVQRMWVVFRQNRKLVPWIDQASNQQLPAGGCQQCSMQHGVAALTQKGIGFNQLTRLATDARTQTAVAAAATRKGVHLLAHTNMQGRCKVWFLKACRVLSFNTPDGWQHTNAQLWCIVEGRSDWHLVSCTCRPAT